MNKRTALIRAVVAAGAVSLALLLIGCDTPEVTDNSSETGSVQCDPNGFGPLSGCDGVDDNTGEPTFQDCRTLVVGCKGDRPETWQPQVPGQGRAS